MGAGWIERFKSGSERAWGWNSLGLLTPAFSYVKRASGLVNVEFILNTLSTNTEKAREQYLILLGAAVDKLEYSVENEPRKETQKTLLQAEMEQSRTKLTWEQLVEKITVEEEISQEKLVGKCRIRQVVAARKRLIYEVLERELMTRTQLAKALQIDPANITRICQELTNN